MTATCIDRRRFTQALLTAGFTKSFALRAQPRLDTLRVLCGYPPGGSVDVVGRKLAEKLTGRIASSAVLENRPGAAGRLAVDELRRSAADGSVALVTPASVMTLYPHVYRQLSYDVFTDVVPVCSVAATAFALAVGPKVPTSVTSVEAFVQWCKAQPVPAQCGNAGAGSLPHFMAMLLAREARFELAHIPYRGGSAAMQAAAAGEVDCALATEGSAHALSQAGRLRVLATSGAERSAFFSQASTFKELGWLALTQREWFGVFMPARVPQATALAVAGAWQAASKEVDVKETWDRVGLSVEATTPTQLQTSMRSEHDFWATIVKASGFTPEA